MTKRFLVTVVQRIDKYFEKEFSVTTEEEAWTLAALEVQAEADGWLERSEDMSSEQYVQCVWPLD